MAENAVFYLTVYTRFISNIKIWEFLYAHDFKDANDNIEAHYNELRKTKLETKICHLLRKYHSMKEWIRPKLYSCRPVVHRLTTS